METSAAAEGASASCLAAVLMGVVMADGRGASGPSTVLMLGIAPKTELTAGARAPAACKVHIYLQSHFIQRCFLPSY